MGKVDEIYDEFAKKAIVERVERGRISTCTIKMFEGTKDLLPNYCSLERFAAFTSNWKPGQTRAGEKAQIKAIQEVRPTFKQLKNTNKGSIFLYNDKSNIIISEHTKSRPKSNIINTKTFDGIYQDKDNTELFLLKTTDIGSFSDSVGGGGQDNVLAEIQTVIESVVKRSFTFKKKPVKFSIMIDGRSAKPFIDACKPMISPTDNIRIGTFEDLFGDLL